MKIEIIRRCRVNGKTYLPGEIVETDRSTAFDRIGAGLAKKHVQPPPAPDSGMPDGVEPAATEEEPAATEEEPAATEEEPKRKKKKKEDTHDA